MKANEILIKDYEQTVIEDFLNELSYDLSYSYIFENSNNDNLVKFFKSISKSAQVGQQCYVTIAAWIPKAVINQKIMKFIYHSAAYEIHSVGNNHVMLKHSDGTIERFPQHAGDLNGRTLCTLFFDSSAEQQHARTMCLLKFQEEWKIIENEV